MYELYLPVAEEGVKDAVIASIKTNIKEMFYFRVKCVCVILLTKN